MELKDIFDNSFVKTRWKDDKVIIRTISFLDAVPSLEQYVERFINLRTFPYVNTTYGKLLNDSFNSLDRDYQIEIRSKIQSYLNDVEQKEFESFNDLDNAGLLEFGFEQEEIDKSDKKELFNGVKGGYYCEMLLSNILMSLGYEIIISKLYFQYGSLSPTGIDVPFINMESKTLVLGECKLYKNIRAAIRSCYKDLDDIYNKNKFSRDFVEWINKFRSMNENVKNWMDDNSLTDLDKFYNFLEKIVCVGFVIGDKIDDDILKATLSSLDDFEEKQKKQIVLITIPTESKDTFVECCYNALKKIGTAIL